VNQDVEIAPVEARYVRYWEPPDGEWNGWGDIFHLRAYSLTSSSTCGLVLTGTLTLTPTPTLTSMPSRTSTPTLTPTQPIDHLALGYAVWVNVVRNDHLNLRYDPVVGNNIIEQMDDGTVVILLEGPVQAGSYVWWRVRAPSGNEGWVVEFADGIPTLELHP
jgi:hypothetical protein